MDQIPDKNIDLCIESSKKLGLEKYICLKDQILEIFNQKKPQGQY